MIVTVTGPVRKLCPYRDEVDEGTVTLKFNVNKGDGTELHRLAESLQGYSSTRMSHEAFTRSLFSIFEDEGISDVTTTWQTAGLDVTCHVDHWDAPHEVPDRRE